MNWKSRLLYSQNWNIGFCEQTPDELVNSQSLKRIQWMEHPYRDRWFADPFIYKVTDDEIVVFVEECPIENPKGILCELVLDKKTKRLKQRYVLLELVTHLSYPAIIRKGGKVYVYPENGTSGKLNIYEYDEAAHCLKNPVCILDEAVADATMVEHKDTYYLIATKYPETQEKAYIYCSDSMFGPFIQMNCEPVQVSRSCSRPGGNWFFFNGQLYRPAQDCVERYGSALSIMKVTLNNGIIEDSKRFSLRPKNYKYNRGLHTINFQDGLCVIDGYGYLYPFVGHVFDALKGIKHLFRD